MQSLGFNFANGYSSGAPATQQPQGNPAPAPWPGGRGSLVISATVFPTTTKLQFIGRSGVAIDVVTVAGNGIYTFDLPAGQYQLFMSGGVATNVNADLVSVRYG